MYVFSFGKKLLVKIFFKIFFIIWCIKIYRSPCNIFKKFNLLKI